MGRDCQMILPSVLDSFLVLGRICSTAGGSVHEVLVIYSSSSIVELMCTRYGNLANSVALDTTWLAVPEWSPLLLRPLALVR